MLCLFFFSLFCFCSWILSCFVICVLPAFGCYHFGSGFRTISFHFSLHFAAYLPASVSAVKLQRASIDLSSFSKFSLLNECYVPLDQDISQTMLTVCKKNWIPLEGQNVFPPQERQCPTLYIHYCTTTTYYRIKPFEQRITFFFPIFICFIKKVINFVGTGAPGENPQRHGEVVLTPHSTHVASLKDTVWGAFLISSSYYVCESVLLFGGNSDIVPPHAGPQMTCGIYWLSTVEMVLVLMFDGECDSLSCWSHPTSSTSVVSSVPESDGLFSRKTFLVCLGESPQRLESRQEVRGPRQ